MLRIRWLWHLRRALYTDSFSCHNNHVKEVPFGHPSLGR